ncbi:MAG: DUF58 domain-containing protein, partial [Bacteroidetes bacterium]|nr:DUF58 domain-containing protein [Bacteroidota bacterium]
MSPLLRLQDIYQFDNLEFIAKQVVEGFIVGMHKSPLHGFSVEFAEHRLYNPGEDVRNIDWKVFARTERLYVKRYEEETNLRCQLVIDNSSSMFYPEKNMNKLLFATYAAASLMHIFKKQRDAVGLSIFSDHLETHIGAKSSLVHHRYLLNILENLLTSTEKNKVTSTATCLHQIAESVHKRSLVVVLSDMLQNTGEPEEIVSALQHLKHNKHEVILFHIIDEGKELEFDFENRPYVFVDLETGEKIKLQANQVKDHYTRMAKDYKKQLMLKCAQYSIDFVPVDINKDFSQILIPYLVKRT